MLTKLEDQLFEQMDRLAKAPTKEIASEVNRSEAMCHLTAQVVDTARVRVTMVKLAAEYGTVNREDIPKLLGQPPGPKMITNAKRTA